VLSPSGYGLADFLLGLPQQSTIQAATEKTYLRANVFDWYAQDDWRVLANLTLNYGLRYEYFSPNVEMDNRLVNLDHNSDFSVVIPVCPVAIAGACGAGTVRSLVNPDRNMYSPRVGFAYRPKLKISMRRWRGICRRRCRLR
jgi:outer membrane receptor protein involved in Fe transport